MYPPVMRPTLVTSDTTLPRSSSVSVMLSSSSGLPSPYSNSTPFAAAPICLKPQSLAWALNPAGTVCANRHSDRVHLLRRKEEQCLRNFVRASCDAFSASAAPTFCMEGKALTGAFDLLAAGLGFAAGRGAESPSSSREELESESDLGRSPHRLGRLRFTFFRAAGSSACPPPRGDWVAARWPPAPAPVCGCPGCHSAARSNRNPACVPPSR